MNSDRDLPLLAARRAGTTSLPDVPGLKWSLLGVVSVVGPCPKHPCHAACVMWRLAVQTRAHLGHPSPTSCWCSSLDQHDGDPLINVFIWRRSELLVPLGFRELRREQFNFWVWWGVLQEWVNWAALQSKKQCGLSTKFCDQCVHLDSSTGRRWLISDSWQGQYNREKP